MRRALAEPSSAARNTASLLVALVESDLRARFGRGPWQLVKWLIDPFAAAGVYLVLVAFVLDRPGRAPGVSIACAVIPFQLVLTAVSSGLLCVQSRRAIILNMGFRRGLIPVAGVLTETVAFVASLLLFVVMMGAHGVAPTLAALWLIPALLVTLALGIASAYPAALLGLWFPDLRLFAISLVRTIFFLAPGLVPLSEIPGTYAEIAKANPFTGLFEAYRSALLYGRTPPAWQLLIPLAWAAFLLAISLPVYRREERHLAKVVDL